MPGTRLTDPSAAPTTDECALCISYAEEMAEENAAQAGKISSVGNPFLPEDEWQLVQTWARAYISDGMLNDTHQDHQ